MISAYTTVSGTSREELLINKSRFIGYCASCESEADALTFLQAVREEHKTATHHCYAYIIGENSGIMRYSDDGEPGGTAGMPIMDVMRAKGIVNCCIVVVRYFGGVLLGTGGLVRAYTQSAQAALISAGVARMELTASEDCEVPYSVWDRVRYAAEHLPVRIENIRYGSAVGFTLSFRSCDRDTVYPAILEASGRMLESIPLDEAYSAWKTE